mmetsp:Transcript_34193/g.86129  ORF Transcript_34193/g.86129 Transcript_34193/m.86129 type:complete len:233 (-) Transcript_34193:486-1184(-)
MSPPSEASSSGSLLASTRAPRRPRRAALAGVPSATSGGMFHCRPVGCSPDVSSRPGSDTTAGGATGEAAAPPAEGRLRRGTETGSLKVVLGSAARKAAAGVSAFPPVGGAKGVRCGAPPLPIRTAVARRTVAASGVAAVAPLGSGSAPPAAAMRRCADRRAAEGGAGVFMPAASGAAPAGVDTPGRASAWAAAGAAAACSASLARCSASLRSYRISLASWRSPTRMSSTSAL